MKKILFILFAIMTTATILADEKAETTAPAYLWKYQGQYYTGEMPISKQTHINLLKNTCPEAYAQYKQGKMLTNTGWSMMAACPILILCVGMPTLCVEPNLPPYNYAYDNVEIIRDEVWEQRQHAFKVKKAAFWSIFGLGWASFVASIPIISVGYSKRNQSIETYNLQCAAKEPVITYHFTASQNGVGLAINF